MIINNLEQLENKIKSEKIKGNTIIWTNGCFDIIHPGHIETFKESKKMGSILVVGVNGDNSPYFKSKPGRPINDEYFRSIMLDSIKYIDYVYIFNEETPIIPIKTILPDILIKGGDYNIEQIVGHDEIINNGGEVKIIPTLSNYSTTGIIKRILNIYNN